MHISLSTACELQHVLRQGIVSVSVVYRITLPLFHSYTEDPHVNYWPGSELDTCSRLLRLESNDLDLEQWRPGRFLYVNVYIMCVGSSTPTKTASQNFVGERQTSWGANWYWQMSVSTFVRASFSLNNLLNKRLLGGEVAGKLRQRLIISPPLVDWRKSVWRS